MSSQDTDNRPGGHNTRQKDRGHKLSPFDGPRKIEDPDPVLDSPRPKSFGSWSGAPDIPTTTSKSTSWKAIRHERLSPPEDFVCPHCKSFILSSNSGRFICPFCGETAHPPVFAYGSRELINNSQEKRLGSLPFVPKVPNPINEATKRREEMNMHKFIRKIKY